MAGVPPAPSPPPTLTFSLPTPSKTILNRGIQGGYTGSVEMTNWQHSGAEADWQICQMPDGSRQESKKHSSNDFRAWLRCGSDPQTSLASPDCFHWWVCSVLSSELIRGKWPPHDHMMGKVSRAPSLISRLLWICETWGDVRQETRDNPHYLNLGPGGREIYTNEKMLRIFLWCRPLQQCNMLLASLAFRHISNEGIFCSLFPSHVSCNNQCGEASHPSMPSQHH